MSTLSNAQIASIFAIYYNCDMVDLFLNSDKYKPIKGPLNTTLRAYLSSSLDPAFVFTQKLILTKPEHLTYNQILELCKIASPGVYGDYRYAKWKIKKSSKWCDEYKNVEVSNKNASQTFDVDLIDGQIRIYDGGLLDLTDIEHHYWQWYFANGIAIPLYPWNKTAIELGVAFEKENTNDNGY